MPAKAQSSPPSEGTTAIPANIWAGVMEDGARTWLSACSGMARAWVASSEIQAEMAGEMMRMWLNSGPAALGPSCALALFASEHRDSPVEQAVLDGANLLRGFGQGAIQPVPLPE